MTTTQAKDFFPLGRLVCNALGYQTPDLRTLLFTIHSVAPAVSIGSSLGFRDGARQVVETTINTPEVIMDSEFLFPYDTSPQDAIALMDHAVHTNLCLLLGLPVTISSDQELSEDSVVQATVNQDKEKDDEMPKGKRSSKSRFSIGPDWLDEL